ncbi:hypothetical protein SH668x_000694 [Planctomicrobium sp. SH668]|uniref:hypothetical protein n=1 Tax=Planctomicrobium sp. SH668 TaxID=3448126 RepID=UPI003F5C136D
MSSPFSIFRRHQRTLMVVVTGLSMISFVLLGAVTDPTQVPKPLIVAFLAAMAGGLAWLAGLTRGKAAEWGLTGALVGAAIGAAGAFYAREASAVSIGSGSLSRNQVSQLMQNRNAANQFVVTAFQETFQIPLQYMPQALQQNLLFGNPNASEITVDDVVTSELLRREADRMGIVISDKAVTDFINGFTTKKGLLDSLSQLSGQMSEQELTFAKGIVQQMQEKKFSANSFTRLRQRLQLSERGMLDAIRDELKAQRAQQLLTGNNFFPPELYWEYYRMMNVTQGNELASVPVSDFIDPTVEPSEADLAKLFNEYKSNFAGFTFEGRPEPGRPGFAQPRRIQIGYFEADYDAVQATVGEVSDEEIQKLYDDRYLKAVPEITPLDGPELPAAPMTEPAPEAPAAESATTELPTTEEAPAAAEPASETPAEAPVSPAPEATPEATPEEAPAPAPTEEGSTSSVELMSATIPVAFLQDEPATETPATETPATETPATETPATETPATETPATETPATETPATEAPAAEAPAVPEAGTEGAMPATGEETIPPPPSDEVPAAPTSEIPVLDDALKAELRDEILATRTAAAISARIEAAQQELSDVSIRVGMQETEKNYLTHSDAAGHLKFYASQHQLKYIVSTPLSYEEMRDTEDYPVVRSQLTSQRVMVADYLFQSRPTDLYGVNVSSDFGAASSYALWKLSDKLQYQPEKIDDEPGIRAQVIKAWQLAQARPKAQARADALVKKVKESDLPMTEALAEETVTGTPESLFIPVRVTGDISWMTKPIVPMVSMQQQIPVQATAIPGAADVGEEFYKKVFGQMNAGDVSTVFNDDHSVIYIVKVNSREPSTPEGVEELRKKFLAEGINSSYSTLLRQSMIDNFVDWREQLYVIHGVERSSAR